MTLHNAVGKPLFDFTSTIDDGARRSPSQESETARTVIDRIRDYAPYRSAMTPMQYRIVAQGATSSIKTMADLFERLVTHVQTVGKKSDLATIQSHWRRHISVFFGCYSPSDITFQELSEFYLILSASGLSERSVKNIMTTLKRMIYLALKLDVIPRLPAFIRIETSLPTFRDVMTQDEQRTFLEALGTLTVDDHKLGIVKAMCLMGLRESEALGMRFEHIREDWYTVVDGKSKNPRTLYLPEEVRKHVFAQGQRRNGYVFPSSRSDPSEEKPHASQFCMELVKEAGRRIGKLNLTQHDLRATCASLMAQIGMPMADLARFLGHASVMTTELYVFSLNRSVELHHKQYLTALGTR